MPLCHIKVGWHIVANTRQKLCTLWGCWTKVHQSFI